MKVFIINHNLLTWTRNMVNYLSNISGVEPIIVDNKSTYPPLLEWYNTQPCIIERLPTNEGHLSPWKLGVLNRYCSGTEYFAVTDPDLDLTDVPPDLFDVMIEGLNLHGHSKCGLSLRVDDLDTSLEVGKEAFGAQSRYWSHKEPKTGYYIAEIDTTLAVYRPPFISKHTLDAVRTPPPYSCRHLPFYLNPIEKQPEDYIYYLNKCLKNSASGGAYYLSIINKGPHKYDLTQYADKYSYSHQRSFSQYCAPC